MESNKRIVDESAGYTVEELSKILGCCEQTILNRIATGEYLATKPGKAYQISKAELMRIRALEFEKQQRRIEARQLKRRQR